MMQQIKDVALEWAAAIQTREPEKVLALYHPDGLLWGTLSPVIRHGHPAILEYFIGFLDREGLSCRFNDGVVREYGDFAFYSGSYEFTWQMKDKTVLVPARFSFIYKKEGEKWLIMEHHSSLFPELPFRVRKYFRP
jgi:uncharacterized protein (TIGR02246 family)